MIVDVAVLVGDEVGLLVGVEEDVGVRLDVTVAVRVAVAGGGGTGVRVAVAGGGGGGIGVFVAVKLGARVGVLDAPLVAVLVGVRVAVDIVGGGLKEGGLLGVVVIKYGGMLAAEIPSLLPASAASTWAGTRSTLQRRGSSNAESRPRQISARRQASLAVR